MKKVLGDSVQRVDMMKPRMKEAGVYMETKSKSEYIKAWNDHVDTFHSLAFCSDHELGKQVNECITKLKEVIPKIADTKGGLTDD